MMSACVLLRAICLISGMRMTALSQISIGLCFYLTRCMPRLAFHVSSGRWILQPVYLPRSQTDHKRVLWRVISELLVIKGHHTTVCHPVAETVILFCIAKSSKHHMNV